LRLRLAGSGFALVAALYLANYFVTPAVVGEQLEISFRPHLRSLFDPRTWKKAGPEIPATPAHVHYGKRFEMVDDLMRSGLLAGAREQRVMELLGTPESTGEQSGTKSFYYFLADQRQYPARSIWFPGVFANLDRWMFEVRFRNGRVVLARVYFT
jgi:hypothetical protein